MTLTPFVALSSLSDAAAVGAALWDSGDFAGAASHWERALRDDGADTEALHGLGRLRLAQNDLAAATLLLEGALARLGDGDDERAQRVRLDLAWALYRLDRLDLAADHFEKLPGMAALAAQGRALGGAAPYRMAAGWDEVTLPFLGTDPLPIVTVTLGGREHAFVLDTGAGQLVVDEGLARELGLPNLGTRQVTYASGESAPIGLTLVPEVTLGELTIRDVPAEVASVRRVAPQISGFIGTSLLMRFNLLFDWEGQVFRLWPRSHLADRKWDNLTLVPFHIFDDHLIMAHAQLNRHDTTVYITSGLAGGSFAVPDSTARQAALTLTGGEMGAVGAGGAQTVREARAERLCLGAWCREGAGGLVGLFPAALEWRYGFRVGAIVGHDFLRGRQWAVEWDRMEMGFA